ncbi:MAG: lasso peptide biosynthesis B2 protein [Pseudomonadota bacterium]
MTARAAPSLWRAVTRLGCFELALLLPVLVLLGLSRLLILCLTFRRIAPWLGAQGGTLAWTPLLAPDQERRAARIGRLVLQVARHTPWQSNCFPQAVTARLLLGACGIPYNLFFGLARSDAGLAAHAWVVAGRVHVSGGASFGRFTVVACFFTRSLAALPGTGRL